MMSTLPLIFLFQAMTINGQNVTPPFAAFIRGSSCLVCLQYRIHDNETDIEARRRILDKWVKRDELFAVRHKYLIRMTYYDSRGDCDTPEKSVTYKKKEDFPLVDVPIPGCRNVWFVKWEKLNSYDGLRLRR
jgi:hypothetical protein